MDEMRNAVVSPEEELIDLLLEFSIVALCLAQKVSRTMKDKQIKEARLGSGQDQAATAWKHHTFPAGHGFEQ